MRREQGEFGVYMAPDRDRPHPGVLIIGGSEGGVPPYAHLFVDEGFAVLAFVYHGHEGVSGSLVEIPLERLRDALDWLIARDDVIAPDGRVRAAGYSKGGELVLLAASLFPERIGAVVAYTPSAVVWQGLDFTKRSSWSLDGRPLPFVPFPQVAPAFSDKGMAVAPIYAAGLNDGDAVAAATIQIEKATGPILVISGGDDRMWPATRMCRMLVERRGRNDIRHLDFPDAGHMLLPYELPYELPPRPEDGRPRMDLGGSPETARAAYDAGWPVAVEHLRSG